MTSVTSKAPDWDSFPKLQVVLETSFEAIREDKLLFRLPCDLDHRLNAGTFARETAAAAVTDQTAPRNRGLHCPVFRTQLPE